MLRSEVRGPSSRLRLITLVQFSMKLASSCDHVRLWHEPASRRLQQCIMEVKSDTHLREEIKPAGRIWVPVLNHRLNGQVKGALASSYVHSSSRSA